MIVEPLQPKDQGLWDEYVDGHPQATCYHLRAWQDVARMAYGHETYFLVAKDAPASPIRGVLPLFVATETPGGNVSNGLFGAYADVLGDGPEVRTALLLKGKEVLEGCGVRQIFLKCREMACPRDVGFELCNSWVIAKLPLTSDPGRIWSDLRDKIRNSVRKAERFGLELRTGHDQLEAFYDIIAQNLHRKGTPIYGLEFMRTLLQSMGTRADIMTLWHQGRSVSGAFLIDYRGTAYVPFASSRPETFKMCPNNLLYWEIIRRACLKGLSELDFGRSVPGTGQLAFKLGWGAEVFPQPCYVYAPSGKVNRPDPNDPRLKLFIRCWRALPRSFADRVGPWICRRFAGLM